MSAFAKPRLLSVSYKDVYFFIFKRFSWISQFSTPFHFKKQRKKKILSFECECWPQNIIIRRQITCFFYILLKIAFSEILQSYSTDYKNNLERDQNLPLMFLRNRWISFFIVFILVTDQISIFCLIDEKVSLTIYFLYLFYRKTCLKTARSWTIRMGQSAWSTIPKMSADMRFLWTMKEIPAKVREFSASQNLFKYNFKECVF